MKSNFENDKQQVVMDMDYLITSKRSKTDPKETRKI